MRKPWFRESDGWWYLTLTDGVGKRRHERLAQTEKAAFDEWHKRMSASPIESDDALVVSILGAFLDWSESNQPAATFEWHNRYLESFAKKWGAMKVRDLKPMHITKWLERAEFKSGRRALSDGAKRGAIASLKRALNWAVSEGYLSSNPIASVKRPRSGRREQMIAHDDGAKLAQETDGAFRAVLIALKLTGCRPKEIRTVEAANVNLDAETWERVVNKTGKATGLPRTVYVSHPCCKTLTRILAHFRPSGPLFLNANGNPWTDNAIRCRMRRARIKHSLPDGTVAYSYRHTYITDALKNGVDAATVAELCGTSVEMIQRHYGHLTQHGEHLRHAARMARNGRDGRALEGNASSGESSA